MPKEYVLKNPIISRQKVDRILKTIKDNADTDRIEASNLLEEIKAQLSVVIPNDRESLEGYVRLVNTALAAINQMGNANDKLLKLTGVIQKFIQQTEKEDPVGLGKAAGSFFSQLTAISSKKDDEDD